jgi:two-component system, sensor histidine kinase and response regulator
MFTAIGLVVVIIMILFVVLVFGIGRLHHSAVGARRSAETLQIANAAERSVVDLETGVRGYLLSGERVFLAPYAQAHAGLGPQLALMASLTKEDAAQQMRVRGIAGAVASYESSYADPLARGSGRLSRTEDVAVTSVGKRLIDAIRGRFDLLDSTEQLHADRERAATTSNARLALAGAGGALAFLVLVLIALAAYLARAVLAPIQRTARAANRLGDGDLATTVPEGGLGEVGALARAFNSMAALVKERDGALQLINDRFHAFLDYAQSAIFIKDEAGLYLVVNREFERIHSVKAQDAIGHTDFEFTSADLAEQRAEEDRQVIAAGGPLSFEQHIQLPEGPRTFLVVKFPVRKEDRIGIAGISTDVTAQRYALTQALEASRLQSEFVANMSHEIRTPLNGVVGMTHLLHETPLDSVQQQYADALAASSEALLSVVNDVLDFSKINAGQLELDPTDFDLRDAVEEACQMLAGQADVAGLKISQGVDAELPPSVNGDRGRLRQILLNLLSNAIKFTPSGEVAVRVLGDRGDVVRFEVSDTGIGIDSDQAAHLFDAFVQADQSTTRRYGGTGLGLTISRELVHRMGGEIGAEPGQGSGSVFWFTVKLPGVTAAEEPARSRSQPSTLEPARPVKSRVLAHAPLVLIAEDNEINRTVAKALLEKQGLLCTVAHNGREAVEMALANDYAAIFMDCQMPELDGYEATRRIRAAENGHRVPIIAMTAHSMPGDRERCLGAGMDDYIAKPVRVADLASVVTRWLFSHETPTESHGPANGKTVDPPAPHAQTDEVLDQVTVAQLTEALSSETREELLVAFEESLPKCVADIEAAGRSGDHLELSRAAHLLKGSSATIGAARLRRNCQRLEQSGREQDAKVSEQQLDQLRARADEARHALREQWDASLAR